jgi:hypothetical protein
MVKKKEARQGSQKKPGTMPVENLIQSGLSGIGGSVLPEIIPEFNKVDSEDVWSNKDSYIVLGRDRDSNDLSGYGGKGHANVNSIDMVVGRGSCNNDLKKELEKNKNIQIDPDFQNDAARIYMSQKTDIDKYFNLNNELASGVVGASEKQSGIGIKADAVRVMARTGIKLVSYADKIDSNGFDITERKGVDLISIPANKEPILQDPKNNMQPIPKGDNLGKALEELAKQLDLLSGIVVNFVQIQNKYNNMVALHTHISPFYGITVPPSIDLQPANIEQNLSTISETINDTLEFKMGYLNKFKNDYLTSTSETYINSRFHHLN